MEDAMLALRNTTLHYEGEGIARVRCGRCGEPLGRIHVHSSSAHDDQLEWEEKTQEELDVLGQGHESACANMPLFAAL